MRTHWPVRHEPRSMVSNINAHPASQTGVDEDAWQLRLMRTGFRALSAIRPAWAEGLAARMFLTPRRHATPARERAVLEGARRSRVEIGEAHSLATYTWGATDEAAPRALLTHGWEGRGSQMFAFVEPLVAAGWRVVAFDHVGHGRSTGKRSSLVRMFEGQLAVGEALGPFQGLVAHSMGGAASAVALERGLAVGRIAFVSVPWDMRRYLERYAKLVTGVDGICSAVVRRLEEHYEITLEETRLANLAPRRSEPLLLVQDVDDRDVPVDDAHLLRDAWPGARLVTTQGLGHRRIVRDPAVVAAVTAHLTGEPLRAPDA